MTKQTHKLLLVVLAGVLLYGVFVAVSGYEELSHALTRFDGRAFAQALLLVCANYCVRWLKWEYYLSVLRIGAIPKLDSALIFLSGFVLTITPGKLGEVFKSAVLAETYGIAVERSAPIVVAERLTDVIGVVVLILLGSAFFSGGLLWALAGAGTVLLVLIVISWPRLGDALLAWLARGSLRDWVPHLQLALSELRHLASPRTLVIPSLLSILGWGCEGYALYSILNGFSLAVSAPEAGFFYATSTLAGALVPVPGGLGVIEALIHQQLVLIASVPTALATASMLMIRFATLWWAVVVGFLALGILKLRFPRLLGTQ